VSSQEHKANQPAPEGTSVPSNGGVKDYVGISKLAELIDRSYPTTLKMVQTDKIHGTRHGSEWRIKLLEVRRFLEQGNNPNPEPRK
jgi:excisionase family DNA binding protein